jgi:hypothetical protein
VNIYKHNLSKEFSFVAHRANIVTALQEVPSELTNVVGNVSWHKDMVYFIRYRSH